MIPKRKKKTSANSRKQTQKAMENREAVHWKTEKSRFLKM